MQTLNNCIADLTLDKDFYDFIIIDEVHHIAANSYRPVLKHFEPSILLGLTATPERMDGADILENFSPGSLSEEEELMLAMFHYDVWKKSDVDLGFVDFRESVKKEAA